MTRFHDLSYGELVVLSQSLVTYERKLRLMQSNNSSHIQLMSVVGALIKEVALERQDSQLK